MHAKFCSLPRGGVHARVYITATSLQHSQTQVSRQNHNTRRTWHCTTALQDRQSHQPGQRKKQGMEVSSRWSVYFIVRASRALTQMDNILHSFESIVSLQRMTIRLSEDFQLIASHYTS